MYTYVTDSDLSGFTDTQESLVEGVRTARSLFLLRSQQSSHHLNSSVSSLSSSSHFSPALPTSTLSSLNIFSSSPSFTPSSLHHPSSLFSSSPSFFLEPPSSTTSSPAVPSRTQSDESASDAALLLPEDERGDTMCPSHTLHLTDRCAWPHCNYACPKLLNPFTGRFIMNLWKHLHSSVHSVILHMQYTLYVIVSLSSSVFWEINTILFFCRWRNELHRVIKKFWAGYGKCCQCSWYWYSHTQLNG